MNAASTPMPGCCRGGRDGSPFPVPAAAGGPRRERGRPADNHAAGRQGRERIWPAGRSRSKKSEHGDRDHQLDGHANAPRPAAPLPADQPGELPRRPGWPGMAVIAPWRLIGDLSPELMMFGAYDTVLSVF